jgi:hypothetical protein
MGAVLSWYQLNVFAELATILAAVGVIRSLREHPHSSQMRA